MNRTARRIAVSAAATAVTLSMAAPAAVAHDRGGSYEGHRDGYERSWGSYGDRHEDGDHYCAHMDRHRHDGYTGDRTAHDSDKARTDHSDTYRSDGRVGGGDGPRHTRWDSRRGDHAKTVPASPVAFAQQQRAMLVYLDRASAFLNELSDRITGSDLDPTLKSTILGLIENRKTSIATLAQQVQAASTLQDLRELRHGAHSDEHT